MAENQTPTSFLERLALIQSELKAPKDLNNSFGGYKYRSNESILEAVKPLLQKHRMVLTQTDKLVLIGDRYYIEATSTIEDIGGQVSKTVTALAREDEDKKGMDSSQVTGSTSSYARKYSLNGLFLIDDTKDADTNELRKERQAANPSPKPAATKTAPPKDSKPAASPSEAVPCEVPNCRNTIRKVVEQQNRTNHDGHAICQFHHTNGDWKAAIERGANPETGDIPSTTFDENEAAFVDSLNNPQVTVNPDGSTALVKEAA